ncbi:MAG: NAD(P)/FAD-dependent oxidoreductase [Solirubrobacterales bacterium]|nr:NAD(P)/FAD-dependent oxidoreductase [Solirubrobacterales bacterium]
MPETRDVVVVGSGHNGLVAAAYLARAGLSVEVLERNPVAGGAVTSEELTEAGFVHDTFSSWHPLFKLSAAYAELGPELEAQGLEYCETPVETTANVLADGRATFAFRDAARTAEGLNSADRAAYLAQMDSFGQTIPTVGELLGSELHSGGAARLTLKLGRQLGRREGLTFAADVLSSARAWFETHFIGPEVANLYAPWALHTGLSPDSAGSGFQVLAIAGSLHAVGLPVVRGGAQNFVRAFERVIEAHGGRVRTGVEVERILTRGAAATGVVAGGEEIVARRAVVANTTPTQLYGHLLAEGAAPEEAVAQGTRFRYSPRAGTQIHVSLGERLRWRDSRLDGVPIVHLSDGPGSVALACAQAAAGLLPARPTVVVGQPAVVDPSRAPLGAGILWIQLQQVPYAPTGDAAGQIDVGDGGWSQDLIAAFTERVLARLAPHLENWPQARGETVVLSPAAIERRNVNLVRGDIYAGDCELAQSYLWRPLPAYGAHATPVERLYQCGASTYPGPGLNAASGRIVARQIIGGDGRISKLARRLRAGR